MPGASLMGEARPGLRGQAAVASLGPSRTPGTLPCSSRGVVYAVRHFHTPNPSITLLLHPQTGRSHTVFPVPTPGPHRHEGSPYLQVQDHLPSVALVSVRLDAVDPGALEETPEG